MQEEVSHYKIISIVKVYEYLLDYLDNFLYRIDFNLINFKILQV